MHNYTAFSTSVIKFENEFHYITDTNALYSHFVFSTTQSLSFPASHIPCWHGEDKPKRLSFDSGVGSGEERTLTFEAQSQRDFL